MTHDEAMEASLEMMVDLVVDASARRRCPQCGLGYAAIRGAHRDWCAIWACPTPVLEKARVDRDLGADEVRALLLLHEDGVS